MRYKVYDFLSNCYRETIETVCIVHHFIQSKHHNTTHAMRIIHRADARASRRRGSTRWLLRLTGN